MLPREITRKLVLLVGGVLIWLGLSRLKRGPTIVAIGSGTGQFTLLSGLKRYTSNITAILTVADDGGSPGMLRRELGVPPPGDIRNCLAALASRKASARASRCQAALSTADLAGPNACSASKAAKSRQT